MLKKFIPDSKCQPPKKITPSISKKLKNEEKISFNFKVSKKNG